MLADTLNPKLPPRDHQLPDRLALEQKHIFLRVGKTFEMQKH